MNTPSAPSVPRTRTGMIILLVIGAILTIAGPNFGVLAGSFALIPGAIDIAENTTDVSPTGTVILGVGESVYLLGPVANLDQLDHESCTTIGPDDEPASVASAPASALNTLVSGARYESFAQLTANTAGTYNITCQTGSIPVITAPPFSLGEFIGPLAQWSIAGIALSLIGIVMVIIGIVRLARTPRAN